MQCQYHHSTALTQKFPFLLNRNLEKANSIENDVCTSYDICSYIVLVFIVKCILNTFDSQLLILMIALQQYCTNFL